MNYRIWKFELQIEDMQEVRMPAGSEILSVANQRGTLCLWAMVDVSKKATPEFRYIEIIGTGLPVASDMGVDRRFIGTVLFDPLVWHVFERR